MIFLMESPLIDRYLDYISVVRRYSERTCGIYAASLDEFCRFAGPADDDELIASLIPNMIRGYEVALLDRKLNERTVNLHISSASYSYKIFIFTFFDYRKDHRELAPACLAVFHFNLSLMD